MSLYPRYEATMESPNLAICLEMLSIPERAFGVAARIET
jgi:hypothetical protein